MTSLWIFPWQICKYFRELSRNIFIGVCFGWSRKFWAANCSFREKGRFLQFFFVEIFDILKYSHFSEHHQKCIGRGISPAVVAFSPTVGCRLESCNFMERKLHCIRFFWIFYKVLGGAISNTLVKTSLMEFTKILWTMVCRILYVYQRQFFETFRDEITPLKKSAMDSYTSSNLKYF